MLRFGPNHGSTVIALLPLLEEANRTRAFTVAVLRALAERGIAGILPDLPGTGDSLIGTHEARLADMREAFGSLARTLARPVSLAIRSGALLDGGADLAGRWHLTPQDGPTLIRELGRIAPLPASPVRPIEVAGNLLAPALLAELAEAFPSPPSRIARLTGDTRPADITLDGPPLWRRAEPGTDAALAEHVANDIAGWIVTCAG